MNVFLTHHRFRFYFLLPFFFVCYKKHNTHISINSLGLGCMRYYSIILEDLAFKHSLRIYCIDRPGVGMSHASDPDLYKVLFFLVQLCSLCTIKATKNKCIVCLCC